MENKSFFHKNFLRLPHLPTIILIIGYVVYWIELYLIKRGRGLTSPLAYILFILFSILVLFIKRKQIFGFILWFAEEYKKQKKFTKYFLTVSFAIAFLIGIIIFFALLLPPHLCQEFDALNYHLTLPRQHLILNSFKHIKWSSADLFPLTIQFALAPYWLMREIPSKFIQIFFVFGLIGISTNLVRRFSRNNFLSICIVTLAILGSHSIGIQMGTAMLDLVICYLFLAALDSFLEGSFVLSAIELAFVTWSKSFFPLIMFSMFFMVLLIYYLARKLGAKKIWLSFGYNLNAILYKKALIKTGIVFLITSIVIGGPFVIKSLYYAGTPLYPFFPGITPVLGERQNYVSLRNASESYLRHGDSYGSDRSIWNFIKHIWIVAVPEQGVNNRFDYPLGLPYLLFVGPFIYLFITLIRRKELAIVPLFVIVYWLLWWFGSQQTRFLYVPLILMFVTISSWMKKPSGVFVSALIIALLFNCVSLFRAHYRDLISVSSEKILREKDRNLLVMNREYSMSGNNKPVILDYFDVAYAQFPVIVKPNNKKELLPWVLKQ